ncbi:MAG: glycosyltransferase family 32 protein [Butyricimonas faecalis]|jgi:hypothetical protein|uniref:Glycosyl transferase n=1 Tax=Butyricimonas faecalis TaxID=2093856 RepID=A0A3S9VYY8_9BACT|nr:glycosyltransferase [Butyricimonas faecalis]AZS31711.1 glycosyl transferase [Butyricimonas faecalis]MBS7154494.1 glycosyl transferase [Sanguibacteroides justesenii]
MIPKVIHYCWFGKGKMPDLALKCLESWKKYCPDYVIKEWNEDNFDLDLYPYAREAYDNRKFAFVTDVVRLYALYHEGGIYMDTDVELVNSIDKFLHHTAFSGFESEKNVPTGIMASVKGGTWVQENLDVYTNRKFVNSDGTLDLTTNVYLITNYMLIHGLIPNNTYQDFPNLITIYPKEFFCPKSTRGEKEYFTKNTCAIHHFAGSWLSHSEQRKRRIKKLIPVQILKCLHILSRR